MDTNKLLYIIWGTKIGADSFFGSSDLDINSGEIQVSLKDIRAFANFSETKIDFYSLQFTSQYKVYTQHRTLNDWLGRPGFMAITVYIPHLLKIRNGNVLDFLNEMVDAYWKKNVNENNRRIKEEREDRSYFNNLIASIELMQDDDSLITKSQKNDKIGLIRYKDYDDLKTYFDLPYQKEYFNFQKIMFFSEDDEHPLSTLIPLTIKPTRQKKYSIEIIGDFDRKKSRYYVNGSEVDYLTGLVPSDIIYLTLVKAFYEPLNYSDSVQMLIQKCRVNNNIIEIHPDSDFTPVIKNVNISFIDSVTSLFLSNLKGTITINGIKENTLLIVLTGKQIGEINTIEIKGIGYKPVKFAIGPFPIIFKSEDISYGSILLEPENIIIPEQETAIYPVKSSTNDQYQNHVQRNDSSNEREQLHHSPVSVRNPNNDEKASKRLSKSQNEYTFENKTPQNLWQLNSRIKVYLYIFIFIGCVAFGSIVTWLIIKNSKQFEKINVYKFTALNGGGIQKLTSFPAGEEPIIYGDSVIFNEKKAKKRPDEVKIIIYPSEESYYKIDTQIIKRNDPSKEIQVSFNLKEAVDQKCDLLCLYLKRLNSVYITNIEVKNIDNFIRSDPNFVDYFIESCNDSLFEKRNRIEQRIACLKHVFYFFEYFGGGYSIGEKVRGQIEYCFGEKIFLNELVRLSHPYPLEKDEEIKKNFINRDLKDAYSLDVLRKKNEGKEIELNELFN